MSFHTKAQDETADGSGGVASLPHPSEVFPNGGRSISAKGQRESEPKKFEVRRHWVALGVVVSVFMIIFVVVGIVSRSDGHHPAVRGGANDNHEEGEHLLDPVDAQNHVWSPLGESLIGRVPRAFLGSSVAMSRNGQRLVVSSKYFSPGLTLDSKADRKFPGLVQVFGYEPEASDNGWSQVGRDIVGSRPQEYRGYTVDISADGARIVTGSSLAYGGGTIEVYEERDGEWKIVGGGPIQIPQAEDSSSSHGGLVVAISDDGNTVAAGADRGNRPVLLYAYDEDKDLWSPKGSSISAGEKSIEQHGRQISLSADGETVAISSPVTTGEEAETNGEVEVFKYHALTNNPSKWKRLGTKIEGDSAGDFSFGWSLSLSGDATRVAVSSPRSERSTGSVTVYELDEESNTDGKPQWLRLGQVLTGEAEGDQFGTSVALSYRGDRLVVGATNNDVLQDDAGPEQDDELLHAAGHVRIYGLARPLVADDNAEQDNDDDVDLIWVQMGYDLDGDTRGELTGYSVSISGNGSRISFGAPSFDGVVSEGKDAIVLPESGQVRVYEYQ